METESTIEYADSVDRVRREHYTNVARDYYASARASETPMTFPQYAQVREIATPTRVVAFVPHWFVDNAVTLRHVGTVRVIREVRGAVEMMRLLRDYSARMRCAYRIESMRGHGQKQVSESAGGQDWKGLSSALTARHSARWSSGVRGDKVRANERVSLRDAVMRGRDGMHDSTMKGLATVGVATRTNAQGWHYAEAIRACRIDRSKCAVTVRRTRGITFAQWSRGEHLVVVPHADYEAEVSRRREDRKSRKTTRNVTTVQALIASLLPSLADAQANAQGIA